MLGKPAWFRRRKYGGWGVFPSTWQGWIYVAIALLPLFVIQQLTFWPSATRLAISLAWLGLVLVDVFDIMARLPRDERERLHEAVAERNALWAVVIILVAGYLYRAAISAASGQAYLDPLTLAALGGGVLVKAATNIYLDRRD